MLFLNKGEYINKQRKTTQLIKQNNNKLECMHVVDMEHTSTVLPIPLSLGSNCIGLPDIFPNGRMFTLIFLVCISVNHIARLMTIQVRPSLFALSEVA